MHSILRVSAPLLLCLLLTGCAAAPAKRDPRDPWERMNRTTYQFNHAIDVGFARPVARTYVKITPRIMRTGVSNFFDNLTYPIVILNGFLQAKFVQGFSDTGRFLLNSTVGVGGLLDPASRAGLDKHEEDFGLTLGTWGIPNGPYFVIPFLGFSDVRDTFGKVADIYTTPTHYIRSPAASWALWGTQLLDTRARLLGTDALVDAAFDPYTFTRNAYLARRHFLLTGEAEEPEIEDTGDDTGAPGAPPPAKPPK
jgi:phospholipid-binding lipoprotein MlaA